MLLELKGVKKHFVTRERSSTAPHGIIRAVDGVDLAIRRGDNVSIVGESGCGKTTLAKIVMGLFPIDAGEVLFEGHSVGRDREQVRTFRRSVRMVFQDPFASLDPRFSVRSILKEALCLERPLPPGEEDGRMRRLLRAVGLPEDILSRYPHEFSGGERQRISIARALMTEPSLVILDEAVSSLDVIVQKKILEMLDGLQETMGVTYLFISHNLRAVRKISRRIAVMYLGRIVEYGTVQAIVEDPRHPYTRSLLDAALRYEARDTALPLAPEGMVLRDVGQDHWVLGG